MPTLRQRLRRIVDRNDTAGGRAFDLTIQVLILTSLVTFSLETVPELGWRVHLVLYQVNLVLLHGFLLEYIARVYTAKKPLRFIFSFYGLVDLLSILPFLLGAGTDSLTLRALRLFRLVWIFKLVRYNRAFRRLYRALVLAREEFVLFAGVAFIVFYLSAVGIHYFEREAQPETFGSVFDAMWWAVITLTTVGYGDAVPVTPGGRVFTAFILILGLGIVSFPAGLIASALTRAREMENSSPRDNASPTATDDDDATS